MAAEVLFLVRVIREQRRDSRERTTSTTHLNSARFYGSDLDPECRVQIRVKGSWCSHAIHCAAMHDSSVPWVSAFRKRRKLWTSWSHISPVVKWTWIIPRVHWSSFSL